MKQIIIKELRNIVGEDDFSVSTAKLYAYAFDASIHRSMPDVVVRPTNTDEVVKIVKLANKHKVPIIPRGAGTALCGHSVPIDGGIVLDMQKMNKIKEIKVGDLYCVVEPGIIYAILGAELAKYGFSFPPEPGSSDVCTVGGMVATNASGTRAIKYGATRDYVMGLEVVLPNGNVMKCGTRTLKNASGYQIERLIVGSEGTLGIVTEITLRVQPLPQQRAVAVAAFSTLEGAGQCVSNIIAKPITPSALEIMDKVCIEAVNRAMKLNLPVCEAILLIEVDGHPQVVKEDVERINKVCMDSGAVSVDFTTEKKRMEQLWAGRKGVLPSLSRYSDNFISVSLADDMAVPMSQVPSAIVAYQKIAKNNGIVVGTYGHAGDGNLHTKVLIDPLKKEHWKNAEKAVGEIYNITLKLGGTVTGEHGVAISKAPYMRIERSSSIETMKNIKKAFDPNNIMNPHKMFQWDRGIITHLRYPVRE
ncbi:MAG: FAD-binding oxidoreductase [Thermoplasmata archaeon]